MSINRWPRLRGGGWNGIVPAFVPGVAAGNTSGSHPAATTCAVLLDSLQSVGRARWIVPAVWAQ
jgi:hypothetical protein